MSARFFRLKYENMIPDLPAEIRHAIFEGTVRQLLEELDSLHGQLDSLRPDNEVWQDLSGLERRDYAARIEALCDRIYSTERKLEELNRLHCDSKFTFNFEALWDIR